jgi:hypothetical protein
MLKASDIVWKLQHMIKAHGDLPVEVETTQEILTAVGIRLMRSDSERGNTIIIRGGQQ